MEEEEELLVDSRITNCLLSELKYARYVKNGGNVFRTVI